VILPLKYANAMVVIQTRFAEITSDREANSVIMDRKLVAVDASNLQVMFAMEI
jgi:hypothetical protein